jgi:predicted permease
MERFRNKPIVVEDGRRGQSSVQDGARTPILLLFAVTGIVLLIACANIANLLFARATNRGLEMAVRLSLGARRSQLLRQLLTESVLLATIGGVASLVVAHWTLGGINSIMPAEIADTMAFHVDRAAITFAAFASVATGLLVGLFPALQSTRPDMVSALRTGSVKLAGTRGASRVRTTLATAQIALSMALLIGAGLFVKSLWLMSRVDLGVDVERLVTFALVPTRNGYAPLRSRQLFDRVEAELRRVPGVTGVTSAAVPIIAGNNWNEIVSVQGFAKGPDTDAESSMNIIGASFFTVTGIPVLAGRDFTATDRAGTAKVAIVNEAFARKFGLGRDAVGKLMSRGSDSLDLTIVGLVKDSPYSEVRDVIPPVFYTPAMQDTTLGALSFYARTNGDLGAVTAAIPSIIKSLDATLPVEELKSMPQQIRENVFVDRIISILSATFAAQATVLAAIGLYGMLAYMVAQRTKEIGVRMALGADPGRVRRMVLRQVGLMTLVGGAIGVVGAIGLGKGASSMLFEVKSFDLAVSVAAAVLLTAVAFAAGYAPALRASRIDPMQALRYE